ncbi:myosin-7-like [Lampetra planeri]
MEFVQARGPEKRGRTVVAVVKDSVVNQMNPPNFDKIGVMAMLISLNESPVLVNLKERSSVVDDLRRASWPPDRPGGVSFFCVTVNLHEGFHVEARRGRRAPPRVTSNPDNAHHQHSLTGTGRQRSPV